MPANGSLAVEAKKDDIRGAAPKNVRTGMRRWTQRNKRKLLEAQKYMLFSAHLSNTTFPRIESAGELDYFLAQDEYNTPLPSDNVWPVYKPDPNSPCRYLLKMVCPCHNCSQTVNAPKWLRHYIKDHMLPMQLPFQEIPDILGYLSASATCDWQKLSPDEHTLLGVYGYQRKGLNPFNCARNTYLPEDYRCFSQHAVLMLFACLTKHAPLWERKDQAYVLVFWVVTPLQCADILLRLQIQAVNSKHYHFKNLKARAMQVEHDTCREFIKTDTNALLIYSHEMRLMKKAEQNVLKIQLQVLGEQRCDTYVKS